MAAKKNIAFLPGVREQDIRSLPYEIKTALIERLTALAEGTEQGARMRANGSDDILGTIGCRKLYLNSPEAERQMEDNRRSGRRAGYGVNDGKGGWRAVYYETTIRNQDTIMVVGVGPRASAQIYEAVEERLRNMEHTRTAQANHEIPPQQATRGAAEPPPARRYSAGPPRGSDISR